METQPQSVKSSRETNTNHKFDLHQFGPVLNMIVNFAMLGALSLYWRFEGFYWCYSIFGLPNIITLDNFNDQDKWSHTHSEAGRT